MDESFNVALEAVPPTAAADCRYRHDDVAAFEDKAVMHMVVDALNARARPGDLVVWRQPFRWHSANGVISGAYEMFDIESVAELLGRPVVYNFCHAAILGPRC